MLFSWRCLQRVRFVSEVEWAIVISDSDLSELSPWVPVVRSLEAQPPYFGAGITAACDSAWFLPGPPRWCARARGLSAWAHHDSISLAAEPSHSEEIDDARVPM
eukprot:1455134-Pyramimonas_sp.AAC.1